MNVKEAYDKLSKLIEEGYGDAILIHTDTRSGVSERCCVGSVEVVDGKESDFYVDLNIGETYLPVYEGN